VVAPAVAYAAGLMPLAATGVPGFLRAHPTYDGRGVLIAILDSGLDASAAGLIATSTGVPKVLDLRDFSGEGRVSLEPVQPGDDGSLIIGTRRLQGAGRIARISVQTPWYAGVLRELPLGDAPASDLNGNGSNRDAYPLVVARAVAGWAVFIDTNLNGSFNDEMPLHDYRQGRETLTLGTEPITLAANFHDSTERPVLDIYFDTSAHGTHVAGIAAGFNLYDITGFHGVAPGAQLLGLKIANNARGGISVHGSMVRAMEYAARFARERRLSLVLSLSFGIGNEREGRAVIDSLINDFITKNPEVVFAVSAGNDGPGLSTAGFPGTADLALTVGATLPGVFVNTRQPGGRPPADAPGFWSARGGETAKPSLLAPGIAYASVPRWNTSHEVKLGTSMAAPHVAGLAACLISAMAQERRRADGIDIARALEASARPFAGATLLDQGTGVPDLAAAYEWLLAGHQGSGYIVRTAAGLPAAFRRGGIVPGDSVDAFQVTHRTGLRAAQFLLRSNVPWLQAPESLTAEPGKTKIRIARKPAIFRTPGVYVGVVSAFNPSDTLAGPLFRLVSTIVIPYDLEARPLEESRTIGASRVQRYFLRVGGSNGTLRITATVPDSANESALLALFEPNGQPFRGGQELALGEEEAGSGSFVVRAEDLVPGVYELDVIAPPTEAVTIALHAEMGSLALVAPQRDGALEAANRRPSSIRGKPSFTLVGAQRSFAVAGRGSPAETLLVRVPAWAARAEVDLVLAPQQWDRFTDFAVTVFDTVGRRIAGEAMDYASGRVEVPISESLAGQPLVIELFPAYAWTDRTPSWRATLAVRFLLEMPESLGGGGRDEMTIVPGGRVRVPLPAAQLPVPGGFVPLIEASLAGSRRRVAAGTVPAPPAPPAPLPAPSSP
jgi:subtilisin family serine protease